MKRWSAEAALGRHRTVSLAALALLVILAWGWLVSGAGMGMDPLYSWEPPGIDDQAEMEMAGAMPHGMSDGMPNMKMAGAAPMQMHPAPFPVTFAMWWIMMVAMMLPSAAPTILLYARTASRNSEAAPPATGAFVAGYLIAWGVFSALAAALQLLVQRAGFVSPMTMATTTPWLAGGVLVLAGVYQITPFKDECLRQCRHPAQFLIRHYRPGQLGALRMGVIHGAYCVGCCWMLMALLFAGGIMNIAWIALITVLVAAEKLLPGGRAISMAIGFLCIVAGLGLLILPM